MIYFRKEYRVYTRALCLLIALLFSFSTASWAYAQRSIFPTVDKKNHTGRRGGDGRGGPSGQSSALDPLKLLGVREPTLLESIQVPIEYGRITERHQGEPHNPLIIHIQDVHVHYEAQRNLAHILRGLAKDDGLKLILVEGGSGDASLSFLRPQASKEKRLEVAEKYLKLGKISGEEYLDLVSDYPLILWGIENEELYDKNLAVFLEVDKFKDEVLKKLHGLQGVLKALQQGMYSGELKALVRKKYSFEKEDLDAVSYYRSLGGLAEAKEIDLLQYPNFDNFLKSLDLEQRIDFDEVDKEHQNTIGKLASLLDRDELSQLAERGLKYKLNETSPKEYYGFLKELLVKKDPVPDTHRNLDLYIDYVILYATRDHPELLREAKTLEEILKNRMFRSEEEKQLSEISNHLDLLLDFFKFNLAPDDLAYYRAHREGFMISRWLPFLRKKIKSLRLRTTLPRGLDTLEKHLPMLESFYEIGARRDYAFVENAMQKIEETDEKMAVLISGGFHTGQLIKLFRERRLSYVVVSPKVTMPSDLDLYHSILKEKTASTAE